MQKKKKKYLYILGKYSNSCLTGQRYVDLIDLEFSETWIITV